MEKLFFILFVAFLGPAVYANDSGYSKKHPYRVEVAPDNDNEAICLDATRPFRVISRKDMKRLEKIIKAKEGKLDPNLDLP